MGERDSMVTAPRLRVTALLDRALAEGWTTQKLATEAGVAYKTAHPIYMEVRDRVIQTSQQATISTTSILVQEAHRARDFALGHMQKLREMVHSASEHVASMAPKLGKDGAVQALDIFGQPIPFDSANYAKAVGVTIKTSKDLLSYAEQVTGVDVAKQIAIKAATAKDGPMHSWDGVESLTNVIEAEIVQDVERIAHTPSLPAPRPAQSDPWETEPASVWDT